MVSPGQDWIFQADSHPQSHWITAVVLILAEKFLPVSREIHFGASLAVLSSTLSTKSAHILVTSGSELQTVVIRDPAFLHFSKEEKFKQPQNENMMQGTMCNSDLGMVKMKKKSEVITP